MTSSTTRQHVAQMDPLPCPIIIAWAEKDRIPPVEPCVATARDQLPGATFSVLPCLPHNPTIDDPELVARTMLAVTDAGMEQRWPHCGGAAEPPRLA